MATLRRVKPLPIPGQELARLKETLHPEYGSQVHEAEGAGPGGETERILVVRVPRDDPDMVNDVEGCIEYLNPGELAEATSCLLVGEKRTLQVPTQPLRDLMAARIQFDRRQCHLLRGQLKPGEHRLFKAPEDPRRLVRLAIRFHRAKVEEVNEDDLAAAARDVGPKLNTPAYREVRSVYLVADKDDVRMDADLFFQDVQSRWGEESERRKLAEEIVQKETATRIREETDRQRLLASFKETFGPLHTPRVTMAPLRQRTPAPDWDADQPAGPATGPTDPRRAAMYAHLDAMLGIHDDAATTIRPASSPLKEHTSEVIAPFPQTPASPATTTQGSAQAPAGPVPPAAPTAAPSPPIPTHLPALQAALQASGFEVLARPGAHGIDLAAERANGFPARVIAYCPQRLDVALADKVLAAAKELQVDLAIVLCADAEPEARKRFIATRARWMDPAGLAELAL